MPILSGAVAVRWFASADFDELEPDDISAHGPVSGVLVVWHGGPRPRVIRVGYGDIAQRLAAFREDPKLMSYGLFGPLQAAWAKVPEDRMRGVAKFLVSRLRPMHSDPLAGVTAIPVTLPF
jgi:hypothetical protein